MKSQVCKSKGGTRNVLLARILDVAASVKKNGDQLARTTRDLETRVAKCTEVDGVVFRKFIVNG